MKATKKAVQEARQRAITLIGEHWLKWEGEKWKHLLSLRQVLRPEALLRLQPTLRKIAQEPEQLDTRQRITIAYLNVIANHNRFPYVGEIQTYIKDRWSVVLDKRVIRRICDELSLPRITKSGRRPN